MTETDLSNNSQLLAVAKTALFVPGVRPERFDKARNSGADLAIFDLEDSVLEQDKSQALENVLVALQSDSDSDGCGIVVRVNSNRLAIELPEIVRLAPSNTNLLGIMLPKAEHASDIPELSNGLQYIAIIESALGVKNVFDIAQHPHVQKLAFGSMDFAAEMDSHSAALHDFARAQILLASKVAGISKPWDTPSAHITDLAAVESEARHAKSLGFGGKLVIHPAQIASVNKAFEVTAAEIEWAKKVLETSTGATQLDGQMVDRPITLQAERILKMAGIEF